MTNQNPFEDPDTTWKADEQARLAPRPEDGEELVNILLLFTKHTRIPCNTQEKHLNHTLVMCACGIISELKALGDMMAETAPLGDALVAEQIRGLEASVNSLGRILQQWKKE